MPKKVYQQIVLLRTSERAAFKRCRQMWAWAYLDGLKSNSTGRALFFGDIVHQALATYYKPGLERGPHPAMSFAEIFLGQADDMGRINGRGEDFWEEELSLGVDILEHYVQTYGEDKRFKVIAPEMALQVDLMDSDGSYLCTYTLRMDALIEDLNTGHLGLFEHKTSASAEKPGTSLSMDEQTGAYWAFAPQALADMGFLRPGQRLDFVLFNILRKAKRDERPQNEQGQFLNKNGTVSKVQPAKFFNREFVYRGEGDRRITLTRIAMEAKEIQMARQGQLAIYKNPADHCGWCAFRDMCEVHETGSDWEALREELYHVGDPYEDYKEGIAR